MNVITANYFNELYKLRVRKKYIVFLILAAAICFFKVGISWILSAISHGEIVMRSANIAMTMLPFFAELYIPLITFMAVTDLFCTEFHDNTIKFMLMRPISRWKIIVSKLMAASTICAVYYAVIFIVCTVLEFVFGTPNATLIGAAGMSYLLDLVPMIVLALMTILLNMTTKSATLAMFLSIAVYAFMKFIYIFGNSFGSMFFASYMQWHKLFIGYTLPFGALCIRLGIVLGWIILLYTASYILFERKEF